MHTQIKSLLMILMLTVFTAQHAAAENFTQQDMAFAFGDMAVEQTLKFDQMELLSSQEMMETEGEVLPFLLAARLGYMAYKGYRAYRKINRFRPSVTSYNAFRSLKGFTKHGLHHKIAGRVSNRAIHHTLKNPRVGSQSWIAGDRINTTRYLGKYSTVVLNRQGRMVTAWKTRTWGR